MACVHVSLGARVHTRACVCVFVCVSLGEMGKRQPATHRIPDLQLDLLAVNVDHAGPKLHTNCQVMDGLEPFVSKLQQKA